MQNVEDFLAHYGKKGMKWGKRSGSSASKGPRPTPAKKLSNQEISKIVKRMELEQKYSDLNKKADTTNKGKTAAKNFISKNGGRVAGIVITGAATAAVAAFLKSPKAMRQLGKLSSIK